MPLGQVIQFMILVNGKTLQKPLKFWLNPANIICLMITNNYGKTLVTAFAVALYNPSDTVCSFSVPFSSLEFGGNVKVRDLVKHNDLGSFSGTFEQTLPAHSAMFLRMEGETRLEPTLYEAEWAYLPLFNDLGKNPKGILYANDKEASGKMKVGFLGGQPENYAEWKEVYSEDGVHNFHTR